VSSRIESQKIFVGVSASGYSLRLTNDMLKRLSIAVLLCLLTAVSVVTRVSAGPAQDENLLGLWKSKHDCVVHIYIDDSGKPAGAAWGARKESAELTIKFSGERRFAWKRKTKKSGFGEDGEADPRRSGRFIVDLHDRSVLHSNYCPCYHPRGGSAPKFTRVSPDEISERSIPKWYSVRFANVTQNGTVAEKSQPSQSQAVGDTQVARATAPKQESGKAEPEPQDSQGGGLGKLLGVLKSFDQSVQQQASGQFPEAGSVQKSTPAPASNSNSGGLVGLFGAAGKKKSSEAGQPSTQSSGSTAFGSLLQGLAAPSQPSSGSGNTPRNFEEYRELITMGPVDAYYLGRGIALKSFFDDPVLPVSDGRVRYLQSILNTLVRYSRSPFLYRSYAVIIIDDPFVNAHAVPGGFIAFYTGMLELFENEDELAVLLAHEIAHSELNHGISAVAGEQGAEFFAGFAGNTIGADALGGFTDSLYKHGRQGYVVEVEAEADARALVIAQRAGYDPSVFPGLMERFKSQQGHYGGERYPPNRAQLIRKRLLGINYLGSAESFAFRSRRFNHVFNR
jgi:beta-barrel assembly-enhancing protease